jgi:SET domain-containing protein
VPAIPGLRVVRSAIHGYGVVAARAFAPGEVIADVDGVVWHAGERRDDRFSLWLDDGVFLDMVDQTRWINHSCAPNAEIEAGADRGGWARIVALAPIAAEQEITYDYGFPAELAEPCSCGAPTCRRWIVDEAAASVIARRRRRAAGATRATSPSR